MLLYSIQNVCMYRAVMQQGVQRFTGRRHDITVSIWEVCYSVQIIVVETALMH